MRVASLRRQKWISHQDDLLLRINCIFTSHPVPVMQRVTYNSFMYQVDKAQRNGVHGEALTNYCRGLLSAYLERRLEREVMEMILAQMFNVQPRDVRPIGYEAEND
jgi:hypothetical protein